MSYPTQGYYGTDNPPYYPPQPNSYDMPSRPGANGISMPPPPPRSRFRSIFPPWHILFSILFWLIFLLIDLIAHHFPNYPYSAGPRRHTVMMIYTLIFQVVWFGISVRLAFLLWAQVLGLWAARGISSLRRVLGALGGALVAFIVVGFPIVALGLNAATVAKGERERKQS
ncbi:hypothetical protein BDZ91DRAFT_34326 [Kalaharituber pfeilii]|nr:hypothetical protein BDZ91DRAFT_34326 [Kalaharituber pfeilii]